MAPVFINLFRSIAEAMETSDSPVVDQSLAIHGGLQLLPGNSLPYQQISDNPDGIELEDWTVWAITPCGQELADLTEYVQVQPFDDYNGIPQVTWSIKNVPIDFGPSAIMLRFSQTAGEDLYSSPFDLTAYESEKTIRIDYWDSEYLPKQSIQVKSWFRNWRNADTLSVYTERSTGVSRSLSTERVRLKRMFTDMVSNDLMVKLVDALECRYVYVDLYRHNLYEAPEIPDPEGDANFAELEYLLSPITTEPPYDPNYVPPVPVPPGPGDSIMFTGKVDITRTVPSRIYRLRLQFEPPEGYDTILFAYSNATINGAVGPFSTIAYSIIGGVVTVNALQSAEINPNQAHVAAFALRMTDGVTPLDFVFNGPLVIFTQPDIVNGIEKDLEATITAV